MTTRLGQILRRAIDTNETWVELPLEEMRVFSNPITLVVSDGDKPKEVYLFETRRIEGGRAAALNPVMAERRARTHILRSIAALEGAVTELPSGRWDLAGKRTHRTKKLAMRGARRQLRIPKDIDVALELRLLNSGDPPASAELARATAAMILPGKLPDPRT